MVNVLAWSRLTLLLALLVLLPSAVGARPIRFDLPAQPGAQALLAFSQQAKTDVLFPYAELQAVQSNPVQGRLEPIEALHELLTGTGFTARRNARGKFVVAPSTAAAASISGRMLNHEGEPAHGVRVMIPPLRRSTTTDAAGRFTLADVPAGHHRVLASQRSYQTLELTDVPAEPGRTTDLGDQVLELALDPARLAPYIVEERSDQLRPFDQATPPLAPRTAAGNLDLRRTEGDVLAFTVFHRDRILRSGVVDLNEFLQRELLESDASSSTPAAGEAGLFGTGSNLGLRGYGADETVILINGRRLPEVLTTVQDGTSPPDVSFIPLSLVQRVDVLPASASALYSGNAVGGVINIILRPDVDVNATEITTTYTNSLDGYDAPQASVSLMHGRSFLDGALRMRLNANFSRAIPPTEAELGYRRQRVESAPGLGEPVYRATPNVRTPTLVPLFGPDSTPVTSVAPGADGTGGRAAFVGREGVRSLELFDAPGGLSTSSNSRDLGYGRKQERAAYFLSTVYDANPWLQLGLDGIHSRTSATRGYDVFVADLGLAADSAFNPFGEDVRVSLSETAPAMGEDYSQARIEFSSAVLGALVKLPRDWRALTDIQYARNVVRYRGFAEVDGGRWQDLIDAGRYNPLRDTQQFGPPAAFYDEVLIYPGPRGTFVPRGEYSVFDAAFRLTQEHLPLPTGDALLNIGADYRRTQFHGFTEQWEYGDGTPAAPPIRWDSRSLERISVFGELQASLLPQAWTPTWLRRAEVNLAARYISADTSQETNLAPTYGAKFDFANGLSVRGSITTSNRYPNPKMARRISTGPGTGGVNLVSIIDPRRNQQYDVRENEVLNLDLRPEDAVTQTAGLIYQRGQLHRVRAAIDYFDTRKTSESMFITPQLALYLEDVWPDRVVRAPAAPGEAVGPVTSVITGRINTAWRHSKNWTASFGYDWQECLGGTLELYGRWLYFEQFEVQYLPNEPVVDQLREPDGGVPSLLRHRANFGAGWSNRAYGFGVDARYFHARHLRIDERPRQGSAQIDPHWQWDVYAQSDLRRWLPWQDARYGLRAQIRVNNIFGPDFPFYWATGVQPYGDWRGRTYSLSLTAVF